VRHGLDGQSEPVFVVMVVHKLGWWFIGGVVIVERVVEVEVVGGGGEAVAQEAMLVL
jgi:hypothetical protein